MNLESYYYYFTSALPSRLCDDIVRLGLESKSEMAVIGDIQKDSDEIEKKDLEILKRKRKSDIVWLSDRWIYKEIQPYVNQANAAAGWNFDWDFSEAGQFTKYGVGQYYGWHCDSWNKPYDNPNNLNEHGKIRKLSVVVSLSNPEEYDGGNLEFDMRNHKDWERDKEKSIYECHEIRPKGSIVVFPSFVWHRVKPVTKGTRYSLVIWNLGLPWR
jgi:PKHD-type hydroxylase